MAWCGKLLEALVMAGEANEAPGPPKTQGLF